MANADLRAEAKAAGVPIWKIGNELGISEPTMTRKLRNELTAAEKTEIRIIIAKLRTEGTRGEAQ